MSLPPEAHIVDNPVHFPACCELCLGQKGPVTDTMVDRPVGPQGGGGSVHVYVCRSCARDLAKLNGFVAGPKLDKLMNAAEERDAMEKRVAQAESDARAMAEALTQEQAKLIAAERDRDRYREERDHTLFRMQQANSMLTEAMVVGANGG